MELEASSSSSSNKDLRILSLDGGEARCFSQLLILKEFMHRLEFDAKKRVLPCDYFHFVVGTGAGGFVATLLVVFGMSVEEAEQAFVRVCKAVFANKTPTARATSLEDSIERLMKESNPEIPTGTKLRRNGSNQGCKLALCYATAENLEIHCKLFRNYPSRQASCNPTIMQAVRATWAVPSLFDPICLGNGPVQERIISAVNYNPAPEAITEAYSLFGAQATISCFLSIGAGRSAIHRIPDSPTGERDVVQTFAQLVMDPDSTARDIDRQIGKLGIYHRFSVDRGFDSIPHDTDTSRFGEIMTQTAAYIQDDLVSRAIDSCIYKSDYPSQIRLDDLRACIPTAGSRRLIPVQVHSRATGLASSHGLPPLSAFFVEREEAMGEVVKALFGKSGNGQRVVVISGLGGKGKTQLVLKFARDFEHRFRHVFFIDSSHKDAIASGIITRIGALGPNYRRKSVEEALEVLANPDTNVTKDWCLIFDNADDPSPSFRISDYLPQCEHGSVIITTRNPELGDLAPQSHIELDVMSPDEAVNALLLSAFRKDKPPFTDEDRLEARKIVERLGFLPVAIIQAGCYIKHHSNIRSYLGLLQANRKNILARPVRTPRDKLKYDHSVYAAFDVTLNILSPRPLHLLRILSMVHFADFPRPLFGIAARGEFKYQPVVLLDRDTGFDQISAFLRDIFCPDGSWDDSESQLVDLFEELQRHSLVSMVPSEGTTTLRFHPLVHEWACDRIPKAEIPTYQSAAVRLLVCGTNWENEDIFKFLSPHLNVLSPLWTTLHANDRAAFSRILKRDRKSEALMLLTKGVYEEVRKVYGDIHIRTSRAELTLADAYGEMGDKTTMETIERKVVSFRESFLGMDDLETIEAMLNLSMTLFDKGQLREAEELQVKALDGRKRVLGLRHQLTAEAMMALARTYQSQGYTTQEEVLQKEAVDILTELFGRNHVWTLDAIMVLADCYADQRRHADAEKLQKEVLKAERSIFGAKHLEVLSTMEWLANAYVDQGKWEDARVLWEEIVDARREVQGVHPHTTKALKTLAMTYQTLAGIYYSSSRQSEAAKMLENFLLVLKDIHKAGHADILNVLEQLIAVYYDLGQFKDMLTAATELFERRTASFGCDAVKTINARAIIAWALQKLERYRESEALFQEILQLRTKISGPRQPNVAVVKMRLAQIYHATGRDVDAEKEAEEALGILSETNFKSAHHENIQQLSGFLEEIRHDRSSSSIPKNEDLEMIDEDPPTHLLIHKPPSILVLTPFAQRDRLKVRLNPWSMFM